MTPEERAVINAAISLSREIRGRHTAPRSTALAEFAGIVNRLVYSCQQCNTETHRCGGCGFEVGHGEYTCSDCEEPPRLNVPASTAGVNDPYVPEIHTASTVATAELRAALERRASGRHAFTGNGRTCRKSIEGTGDSFIRCGLTREEHAAPNELIWHPRTMKDARKGDQIRPAGSDMPNGTAVTDRYRPPQPATSNADGSDGLPLDHGTWHVVPGAKHWDDHVVQDGEVWLCLDGAAPRNVDPDFPIEILLTRAEIAAIELLGWDNREETR